MVPEGRRATVIPHDPCGEQRTWMVAKIPRGYSDGEFGLAKCSLTTAAFASQARYSSHEGDAAVPTADLTCDMLRHREGRSVMTPVLYGSSCLPVTHQAAVVIGRMAVVS